MAWKGRSGIEWTGPTWNPVRGCVEVTPGCAHCYARTFAERFRGVIGHPYEQGFDPRIVPWKLDEPLRVAEPDLWFVNSMSDLWQRGREMINPVFRLGDPRRKVLSEGIPWDYVGAVFGVMAAARHHRFQLLTKGAEEMVEWFAWQAAHPTLNSVLALSDHAAYLGAIKDPAVTRQLNAVAIRPPPWPLPNLAVGVSVEDRANGLPRIDWLRKVRAALRWLSIEPLLESLGDFDLTGIGWVVVGGESGNGARPCSLAWIEEVVNLCRKWNVPVFVKQLGRWPTTGVTRLEARNRGNLVQLRSKKGNTMDEWPPHLRVREFAPGFAPVSRAA